MASKSHSRPTLTCPQDKNCNRLYTDKFICHKAVQNNSSKKCNFAPRTCHCAKHLHRAYRTLDSSASQLACHCKHAKKNRDYNRRQSAAKTRGSALTSCMCKWSVLQHGLYLIIRY